MSLSVMRARQEEIWKSGLTAMEKLLVLALGDWADDDGHGVRPSVDRMMFKTGMRRRLVLLALKRLRDEGVLVATKRATFHSPVEYRIDITKLPARSAARAPLAARDRGAAARTEGCSRCTLSE